MTKKMFFLGVVVVVALGALALLLSRSKGPDQTGPLDKKVSGSYKPSVPGETTPKPPTAPAEPEPAVTANAIDWPIAQKSIKWTNVRMAPAEPEPAVTAKAIDWPIAQKSVQWTNVRPPVPTPTKSEPTTPEAPETPTTPTVATPTKPEEPAKPEPPAVVLAANDVSILFPAPVSKDVLKTTISIGELGDAWPDEAFDSLVDVASSPAGSVHVSDSVTRKIEFEDEFKSDKAKWHISGIRIDPSAPGVSDEIRKQFGTSPQIRLILSPVTGDQEPQVHDFAVHLIYSYPIGVDDPLEEGCFKRTKPNIAAFKAIIADVTKLKVDLSTGQLGGTSIVTDGKPLGVHPGLDDANTKMAVRDRIKALLLDHLPKGKLVAMAIMGIENGFEPWMFLALQLDATGKFDAVPSPSAIQSKDKLFSQMLSFADGVQHVLPEPANNNQKPITCQVFGVPKEARSGVSTLELFMDEKEERVRPVVDVIADPGKSHFFNTDCISCHTETQREMTILKTETFDGLDVKVLPENRWNVRNFGWFKTKLNSDQVVATATRRTATETAEILGCVNDLDACFARVP